MVPGVLHRRSNPSEKTSTLITVERWNSAQVASEMDISLEKRHGSTHFANIQYGYYVLGISVLYLVFLILLRRVVSSRPTKRSDSKVRKLLSSLSSMTPVTHIAIIWILVLIPFYHHYSLISNATVYMKRLGRLSYVLLTLNLILNLRPNWLMHPNYTYTDFIPLHKWLSRTIVMVASVHGILFLVWWAVNKEKSVSAQLAKPKNALGLVLMVEIALLLLFSLKPFRRLNYNLFYVTHNIFTINLILLTAIHARPGITTPYLIINALILAIQAFFKTFYARRIDVLEKITDYRNTNLVGVQLPRSALPEYFEPGCHIRISPFRRINPLYWLLPSHPFTVASLPSDDKINLIIAENRHPRSFRLELGAGYTVINQYNPAIPRTCLSNAQRVTVVCGGSGISFGLPLYRYFKEVHPVDYLQFVWLVRDKHQLKVLEDATGNLDGSSDFHIFITKNPDSMEQEQQEELPDLEFELESFNREELDENGALRPGANSSANPKIATASINVGRRINWASDLSHFVDNSMLDNTWLLACGPETLIESGREYAADNGINFASEVYAL